MINVGIIGTGFIGTAHIEALRRLGNVNIIAVCNSSQDIAEQHAAELYIPHAYSDVAEFLQHDGLDVVHNCTPNHLHAEINRQIINAGKHVFSEKPLSMTLDEAKELEALVEEVGVIHGVSFVYRQFAMVQQAASMIRHQQLGRLFSAQGSYLQDWMLEETDYNWRVDAEKGGASRTVADIGSHWCDTVQFVTGRKIVEVMADLAIVWPTRQASVTSSSTFGGHDKHAHYEPRKVTTEDMGFILFRFDDGSKGSFSVSQVAAGRKNRLNFEINGSLSSLAWDQESPQYLWSGFRHQANQQLSDDPSLMNADIADRARFPGGHIEGWPDAFSAMMRQFYLAVAEGKPPTPSTAHYATFHDGAQIMAVVDAILQSHRQQAWVSVEY